MFPLKDNIRVKDFPVVNIALIGVNVVFFLYEMSYGSKVDQLISAFGFIPARFLAQEAGNWLSPSGLLPVFTSMFLHANLIHLLSNMWFLYIFGDNVEDCMGHGRYLLFFLLCGMAAVFAQVIANPQSTMPMIGASGAISGVLGAYFLTYPHARILTLLPIFILFYIIEVPAYFFLGFWFFLQFLQGSIYSLKSDQMVGGGVAWWAHVGGFAAGVVLLQVFRCKDWQRQVLHSEGKIRRLRRQ
jgi:membrane associated rhomboid family serine protease